MFTNNFFRTAAGLIMILILIVLALQIPYVANNFAAVVAGVLIPLSMAGFFYYLLRPLVRFLHQKINSKNLSIIITFIGLLVLIFFIIYFAGSIIYTELGRLIKFLSDYEVNNINLNQAFRWAEKLGFLENIDVENRFLENAEVENRVASLVRELTNKIGNYDFLGAFASLTQFGLILLITPFLIVYFLKDDEMLARKILSIAPQDKRKTVKEILKTVDTAFGIYIPSQLLVGMISGGIMLVGYLLIGIANPIGLSIILALASVIPFIGPLLGVLPAFFIALTDSLGMVVQVAILMTIVQQFEGNVIRPILQGGKLDMHPVVVIFVVLIGTLLFGVLGALFAVPVFASVRGSLKVVQENN